VDPTDRTVDHQDRAEQVEEQPDSLPGLHRRKRVDRFSDRRLPR
jgi:hypothetical protein